MVQAGPCHRASTCSDGDTGAAMGTLSQCHGQAVMEDLVQSPSRCLPLADGDLRWHAPSRPVSPGRSWEHWEPGELAVMCWT